MVEASAQPPVILAQGLTRRFGSTVAVDGLDLTVARGEVFGLIGPDGAGKSTTLRLLAALMNPSAGQAAILGYDTRRGRAQIKRRIGYMPQRFSLYGDLTVMENISFFADLFGVRRVQRQQEIPRLLHFARLTEFTRRRAAQLSGGMQKKLALACTLIHAPQVLLLDEPTTGVDPVARREFWDMLAELRLQGISLLITTPYMDEAERCSRVGLMDNGRFVACDTPQGILSMAEGELVTVWPSDLRQARQALHDLPGLISVRGTGFQLRCMVENAQSAIEEIRTALDKAGVGIQDIRADRIRMEEAFFALVRARDAGPRQPHGHADG